MKKYAYFCGFLLMVFFFLGSLSVQAEEIKNNTGNIEIKNENVDAEKWNKKDKILENREETKSVELEQEKNKKDRYILLLKDNGFAYYLDSQNVKWKPIPYSEAEEILDVWIKLINVDSNEEEYSYPKKYFLEHYYIRPKRQQIQFLSELEVAGRPDNAIKERAYSVHNWENIVSGSLEDEIYHKVMAVMKKKNQFWPAHTSVRDVLEDIFRISL